jgi:hypothetical protein
MDVFDLALVSSGNLFLWVLAIMEVLLVALSIYLIAVIRHQHAMGVCLPLTLIPLFAGCFRTLMTLATAVTLSEAAQDTSDGQPNFVMLMGVSLTPLLLSAVVAAPAFLLLSTARLYLTVRAHLPKRVATKVPDEEKVIVSATAIDDELASNYLAKLTRSRN